MELCCLNRLVYITTKARPLLFVASSYRATLLSLGSLVERTGVELGRADGMIRQGLAQTLLTQPQTRA